MAHLKTQETRKNPQERRHWKWVLTRRLYEQGYSRYDIIQLFRFIDWLMQLLQALQVAFRQQVYDYEQEQRMPYITSIERMGIEQGRAEGLDLGLIRGRREELLSAIELMLKIKFGEAGSALLPEISRIKEYTLLRQIRDGIWTVATVEELRRSYEQAEGGA